MKKTNYHSIQSLKKLIIAFVIFAIPYNISAQNAESCKTFINNSGFAVFEAQKAVFASNKTNVDGQLAKLMQLQMNAVELFNKKEFALAALMSNLSREESIKLLIKLNGQANQFYTVKEEEKKLFASASSQAYNDFIGKQKRSTLSSKDADYLNASFNSKIMIQ